MRKINPCSLYLASLVLSAAIAVPVNAVQALPKCLYISSYHSGYAWSDGVEEGVRSALESRCEIRQIDMDTKRRRSAEDIRAAVDASIEVIESWKPDVVITSDDNAAKYLIVPHYMNHEIPFVFSGINWTVEEYSFPATNITGIVEVAPIDPMLREAIDISNGLKGVYIGADTLTEQKNYDRIKLGATRRGSHLGKRLVPDAAGWKAAFIEANRTADYIVMGSNSGIEGWDDTAMADFVQKHGSVISVTNHRWMMPVTALGYTKLPFEHGWWSGQTALEILNGTAPLDIPIVTNRKWDIWINQSVLSSTGTTMSQRFTRRAKKFVSIDE